MTYLLGIHSTRFYHHIQDYVMMHAVFEDGTVADTLTSGPVLDTATTIYATYLPAEKKIRGKRRQFPDIDRSHVGSAV